MKFDKLFISFSGGETSAYMTKRMLEETEYNEAKVVFANTGLEHEGTLRFVDQFSQHFDIEVVWVEAKVHHKNRVSTTGTITDFKNACRDGEPFEEMIKKYGIPCNGFPHCTRELKIRPLHWFIKKHLGWKDYHTAIGIRADEFDRMAGDREQKKFVYPLVTWNVAKPFINRFWEEQPFRLEIKGYEGNCVSCWKKSFRKHYTILSENPHYYDHFDRWEEMYANAGAGDQARRFFRGHKSVKDLKREMKEKEWEKAGDDRLVFDDLDSNYGCSESCEIY